jgi:hypothetical protein|tara:strand:- start:323 stop:430 length:108 start_codon:yes stop_codon:yes gene_type:complete
MLQIYYKIISWLKGYRKISPAKYVPDIPEKPKDKK